MAKPLEKAIIKDCIRIEDELTKIIKRIVDGLIEQEAALLADLASDYKFLDDSISKLAWQTEIKIKLKQLRETKRMILKHLKKSTVRMVLASVELTERIN